MSLAAYPSETKKAVVVLGVPSGDRGNWELLHDRSHTCMFCEESLGKIKFRAFPRQWVHEFYRLKALTTLEQVNPTVVEKQKKNLN